MNKILLKSLVAQGLLLSAASVLATPAFASTPWVGTADYLVAPGASGTDEGIAGPFDTYDFGNGVGAIVNSDPNLSVGSTFTGYYQTYVTRHELAGTGINLNQLDTSGGNAFTGISNGFELTLRATFNGQYTANSGTNVEFDILPGGSAELYFDTNPNYSFAGDSGFNDGSVLLSGAMSGGSGTLLTQFGFGVSNLTLDGFFGNAAPGVYTPNTIGGGTSLFTLNLNNPAVLSGVSSVMGQTTNLYAADGSLQLTAVPLPSAAWMFLSAMLGFVTISRKKLAV